MWHIVAAENVEKETQKEEKSRNGVYTKASHYKWFSFRVCSPGSHETCADICTARLKHPHLARKSPHCGLVTRAVSGQVMHATGSMEDGPVLELCYIEKTQSVGEQGRLMALWASVQASTVRDCILFLNVSFIYLTHVLRASVRRIQTKRFGTRIWMRGPVVD